MQIMFLKQINISLPIDFRTGNNDSVYVKQMVKKTQQIRVIEFIVIFQCCQNKILHCEETNTNK